MTFDDACEGALQFAVPELAARSIPATIFIAPGLLGNESPWWDRLADPALGAVAVSIRDRALVEFKGRHDQILQAADALGWTVHPPDPAFRIGTEDDLERALRLHPGLTLGAHSWSHANLTSLDAVELQEEMVKPLQWLRERWPDRTIPWLAYPYGLESPAVRRAAAKAGYQGALLVRGGWHRDVPDPFGVPRLNVSAGISLNGFRARLNGLIPG